MEGMEAGVTGTAAYSKAEHAFNYDAMGRIAWEQYFHSDQPGTPPACAPSSYFGLAADYQEGP